MFAPQYLRLMSLIIVIASGSSTMGCRGPSLLYASGFRTNVPFPACLLLQDETDSETRNLALNQICNLEEVDVDTANALWRSIHHISIIPLARGSSQANPIYSERPGSRNQQLFGGEQTHVGCNDERISVRFRQGWIGNMLFVSAQCVHPGFGTKEVHDIGWINIWSGRGRDRLGTLYCTMRHNQRTTSECCLCGRCVVRWLHRGWCCPLIESRAWNHQQWRVDLRNRL